MMHIKNINREQANEFWKLRLEALQSNPEAFGSSYEDNVHTPMNEVILKINNEPDNYILGAFTENNELMGIAGFRREQGMKVRHKGMIWGVYVSPTHRGKGIARELMQEILHRGTEIEGLQQIQLSVVTANHAAAEQYKRLGFVTYGVEKDALIYQGQGFDEELMTYFVK
ncbi:GNAT family N-acetyltransferase [Paenibacillus dokdonensis]|uniref:GNAT family N-acetyltransferase n=1 Tax=Paenibacillus dokdonensis TaxID=2567944 RepID=A0ABU6GGA4_9BACL|nr:GNAT family N-acetyltransferase [Paenibacillus dokdonensis]MEC0238498.1 GNAT family N-acetyltransferase [Paenibacillus dokdonensis]